MCIHRYTCLIVLPAHDMHVIYIPLYYQRNVSKAVQKSKRKAACLFVGYQVGSRITRDNTQETNGSPVSSNCSLSLVLYTTTIIILFLSLARSVCVHCCSCRSLAHSASMRRTERTHSYLFFVLRRYVRSSNNNDVSYERWRRGSGGGSGGAGAGGIRCCCVWRASHRRRRRRRRCRRRRDRRVH